MCTISVIIPSYNCEKYLAEAVESIINQTVKVLEIIIVNDGSIDCTQAVAESFKNKYPDIIKLVNQENQGPSAARNRGLKIARGDYICFQDADDISLPYRLELQSMLLDKHNDISVVFTPVIVFESETKSKITTWGGIPLWFTQDNKDTFSYLLLEGNNIPTSSLMFRKSIIDQGHFFSNDYRIGEDYHFFLSASANNRFFCYQEPLVMLRREHEGHLTRHIESTQIFERQVINDIFTSYSSCLGLDKRILNKALSNSYLRDFEMFMKQKKIMKSLRRFIDAFYKCPNNPKILKSLISCFN